MSEIAVNSSLPELTPRRFLFLFSDTGGGHRASGTAIKDEMEKLYGRDAYVDMVDLFVELERWPFDRFPEWYPSCFGLNGIPWSLGFHLSNRVTLIKTMSRMVWPYTRSAMCELLKNHPADVVVSLHPIPNAALYMALQALHLPTPVAVVALDMVTPHASWFVPGAQIYLVPTEEAKIRAVRWGLSENLVEVTGMPTRGCFRDAMALSQSDARALLGIHHTDPLVLIVGGGDGMGPIPQVVQALVKTISHAYIMAIAGRNQTLYHELARIESQVPLEIKGFVSNIEVCMRAADVLVTKAGPNTLSEAFITGLPIVIYTALPGQETGNVSYVVDNGAGMWAPSPSQVAEAVNLLLANPATRQQMADCSRRLAHPHATRQIAQRIWQLSEAPEFQRDGVVASKLHASSPW